jgi:hypothetical protein
MLSQHINQTKRDKSYFFNKYDLLGKVIDLGFLEIFMERFMVLA